MLVTRKMALESAAVGICKCFVVLNVFPKHHLFDIDTSPQPAPVQLNCYAEPYARSRERVSDRRYWPCPSAR